MEERSGTGYRNIYSKKTGKERKKGIRVRKERKKKRSSGVAKSSWKKETTSTKKNEKKERKEKEKRRKRVQRVAEAVMWIDGWRSVRRRQEQGGRLEGRE